MPASTILANTALLAVIGTGIGWLANRLYEIVTRWIELRRNRTAAIIRFYVDTRLRLKNLRVLEDQTYADRYSEKTASMIEDHEARSKPFRLYGAQISDGRSHDLIDTELATFDLVDAELIREVILLDRQMVAQYEKLGTQEFTDLDKGRKLEAFREWLTSAQSLVGRLEELQIVLERLPELRRRRKRRLSGETTRVAE